MTCVLNDGFGREVWMNCDIWVVEVPALRGVYCIRFAPGQYPVVMTGNVLRFRIRPDLSKDYPANPIFRNSISGDAFP